MMVIRRNAIGEGRCGDEGGDAGVDRSLDDESWRVEVVAVALMVVWRRMCLGPRGGI